MQNDIDEPGAFASVGVYRPQLVSISTGNPCQIAGVIIQVPVARSADQHPGLRSDRPSQQRGRDRQVRQKTVHEGATASTDLLIDFIFNEDNRSGASTEQRTTARPNPGKGIYEGVRRCRRAAQSAHVRLQRCRATADTGERQLHSQDVVLCRRLFHPDRRWNAGRRRLRPGLRAHDRGIDARRGPGHRRGRHRVLDCGRWCPGGAERRASDALQGHTVRASKRTTHR